MPLKVSLALIANGVSESSISTFFKDEQPRNAWEPIDIIKSGIFICVKFLLDENAPADIPMFFLKKTLRLE